MIRRFLCKLGFHEFGLFVIENVIEDIDIARRQCRHCPRHYYDDPDHISPHLIASS